MFRRVIQDLANRRVRAAHHAFHAVSRADVMAFVDALDAAGADENVFVVVRHADDFVRHDLPDGQNQLVSAAGDEVGNLRGPRKVHRAFGDFFHKSRRHFADGSDAGAPVVDAEKIFRHAREQFVNLLARHRGVRA